MRTRPLLLLLLLVGTVVAPTSRADAQSGPSPAPTPTGLGIRLTEAPKARADDPRALTYVVDHVSQGTTLSREVELTNDTDRPAHVRLYVGSARIERGQFTVDDGEGTGRLPAWGHLEPGTVDIPARGHAPARLVIAVPGNAPDGEVYGAALAELVAPPEPGAQVRIITRVGVRIYLSVGSGTEPKSDFEVSSLAAGRDDAGHPVITARVRNTGARALDMAGELRLTDGPGGIAAGPFPARLGTTLAPGQTAAVTTLLDTGLPVGPWTATMTLRSGALEHAVAATVTFPAPSVVGVTGPTVTATSVDGPGRTVAVPVALASLALAMAGLVQHGVRRQRRKVAAT